MSYEYKGLDISTQKDVRHTIEISQSGLCNLIHMLEEWKRAHSLTPTGAPDGERLIYQALLDARDEGSR